RTRRSHTLGPGGAVAICIARKETGCAFRTGLTGHNVGDIPHLRRPAMSDLRSLSGLKSTSSFMLGEVDWSNSQLSGHLILLTHPHFVRVSALRSRLGL